MKKKIFWLVVIFLLFVPFRLPIGVLFIDLVTWIAGLAGPLGDNILVANVIVTKIIYDLALAAYSILSIERLGRAHYGRRGVDGGPSKTNHGRERDTEENYWFTYAAVGLYIVYIVFDGITTYELYFYLIK